MQYRVTFVDSSRGQALVQADLYTWDELRLMFLGPNDTAVVTYSAPHILSVSIVEDCGGAACPPPDTANAVMNRVLEMQAAGIASRAREASRNTRQVSLAWTDARTGLLRDGLIEPEEMSSSMPEEPSCEGSSASPTYFEETIARWDAEEDVTGIVNIAVGNNALNCNVTSSANIAIGMHALDDNTTGSGMADPKASRGPWFALQRDHGWDAVIEQSRQEQQKRDIKKKQQEILDKVELHIQEKKPIIADSNNPYSNKNKSKRRYNGG